MSYNDIFDGEYSISDDEVMEYDTSSEDEELDKIEEAISNETKDDKIDDVDDFGKDIDQLYFDEMGKIPLLTEEEEIKYGNDLALKYKIKIFDEKRDLGINEVRSINLDKVFISLIDSNNAKEIIDILMNYYYSKENGINKRIRDSIFKYKNLFEKFGRALNMDELKEFFGIVSFDVDKLNDKELLEQIGLFIKYSVAFDMFVNANQRLVISRAKYYWRVYHIVNMNCIDLINEGNFGLIRAIEKFDISKGFKFSTYAVKWIDQRITRGIVDKDNNIRIPNNLYVEYHRFLKKVALLRGEYRRNLTREEISKELGIDEDMVKTYESLENSTNLVSLDYHLTNSDNEDGDSLVNLISNDNKTPEESYLDVAMGDDIVTLFKALKDREREVIKYRFGFYGKPRTLEEVGAIYDVTRERIRQIEAKALKKLKNRANNIGMKFD